MRKTIKSIATLILPRKQYVLIEDYWRVKQWKKNNYNGPSPNSIKQKTISEYQKKYNYNILVETGTYRGDMVEAQRKRFGRIISVEISEKLFRKAQKRFKNKNHIEIMHGDSGNVLPFVMKKINEPAIFWLDGHYSAGVTERGDKDCPIFEELDAIFNADELQHVLLIDDARCFNGQGDYPTKEKLTEYIRSKNAKYRMEIKHDILRYIIVNSN